MDGEYDESGNLIHTGSYTFNGETNTLIITDNQRGVNLEENPDAEDLRTITSELSSLTIFINGETPSKLKSIVSNTPNSTLTFTGEGNEACKLIIKNNRSAIRGFGKLDFDPDWGVKILEPEGVKYADGTLYQRQ